MMRDKAIALGDYIVLYIVFPVVRSSRQPARQNHEKIGAHIRNRMALHRTVLRCVALRCVALHCIAAREIEPYKEYCIPSRHPCIFGRATGELGCLERQVSLDATGELGW